MIKKTVKGDLHSFIAEIGRITKTVGSHYTVVHKDDGTTVIEHHNGRWKVIVPPDRFDVTIETNTGDKLIVAGNSMYLNGEYVDRICGDCRCFNADDIKTIVFNAILLWHVFLDNTEFAIKLSQWFVEKLSC